MEKRMAVLACAVMALAIPAAGQLSPAGEGRRLYLANNCYGCHGGRAGGGDFGFRAPEFRGEGAELGDLTEVLREGGEGGMPAYPNLTATDINNLYAYFQSLRTPAEPTFNDWWEAVPTATNRRLYLPWPAHQRQTLFDGGVVTSSGPETGRKSGVRNQPCRNSWPACNRQEPVERVIPLQTRENDGEIPVWQRKLEAIPRSDKAFPVADNESVEVVVNWRMIS